MSEWAMDGYSVKPNQWSDFDTCAGKSSPCFLHPGLQQDIDEKLLAVWGLVRITYYISSSTNYFSSICSSVWVRRLQEAPAREAQQALQRLGLPHPLLHSSASAPLPLWHPQNKVSTTIEKVFNLARDCANWVLDAAAREGVEKVVCHAFSNNGAALYQQFSHLVAAQGDVRITYFAAFIKICQVNIAGAVFDSAPGPLHMLDYLFPYKQTKDPGIQQPLIRVRNYVACSSG